MAGVYISIPFCSQKCTYCNFASGVFPKQLEDDYYRVLEQEIRQQQWTWTPDTVYFGGGSPNRLDLPVLERLLAAIPGKPWNEATLECAPGEITAAKADGWAALGINRVSLGVQSFNERELAQTGRKHRADTVQRDLETLRAAGIANLNLDLIAGLPFQTVESFHQSLDWILRLDPPHVSVYMLEVDEDSRLGKEMLEGGRRYGTAHVPDEGAIVSMYTAAVERLGAAGIARYEISNFARPGYESRHNLKYWRLEPYTGLGADAHSFDGSTRRQNAETAAEYVSRANLRQPLCVAQTPAEVAEERLLVGLRLAEGVPVSLHEQTRLRRFVERGWLEESGEGRMRLTSEGVLFSNEVFEEFVHA